MKRLFWLLLLSPLAAFPQTEFTIKAHVMQLKDGDKLYFYYSLDGVNYKDSTTVKDQSFVFNGHISGHAKGAISARENPFSNIEFLHDEIHLYVEPGTITINGTDSLKYAIVGGTPINKDYTELENELKLYNNELGKISDDFDALTPKEQKKVDRIAANRIAYYSVLSKMAPVKLAFIKQHKNSYMSLITLSGMLNQADVNEIDSAYKSLSAQLKKSADGMAFASKLTAAKRSRVGTIATNFKLHNAYGKLVSLSAYRGKYVLIDFWASWCTPCRHENPHVLAAFKRFKPKNFTVLSVSIDDLNAKADWLRAIKKDGLPWVQLLDENKKVYNLYGVTYIPANFLLDPEGRVIATNLKDEALMDKLSELLITNK